MTASAAPRTNSDRLVTLGIGARVSHPTGDAWSVDSYGRPIILPGMAGVCYNVRVGSPVFTWAADHLEAAVSAGGAGPPPDAALQFLAQALEALAVRGAAERMTLDDVDHLRLLLIRQKRAADAEREDDFIELDEEFHLRIAAGAGMPVVERLLRQLRGFVRVMHIGTTRPRGYLEHVLAEHTAIVDALEERDAGQAAEALREHLDRSDY